MAALPLRCSPQLSSVLPLPEGKRQQSTSSSNQLLFNSSSEERAAVGPSLFYFIVQGQDSGELHTCQRTEAMQSCVRHSPGPSHPPSCSLLDLCRLSGGSNTFCSQHAFFGRGIPLGSSGQSRSLESWLWGCCRLSPTTGIRGRGAPRPAVAPTACGCSPPLPLTHSRGSPEQKPQTFGRT